MALASFIFGVAELSRKRGCGFEQETQVSENPRSSDLQLFAHQSIEDTVKLRQTHDHMDAMKNSQRTAEDDPPSRILEIQRFDKYRKKVGIPRLDKTRVWGTGSRSRHKNALIRCVCEMNFVWGRRVLKRTREFLGGSESEMRPISLCMDGDCGCTCGAVTAIG